VAEAEYTPWAQAKPSSAHASHSRRLPIDRFLGDFTREWNIQDVKIIKPFLTASVGVARMSTPASNATRFVFGIGTIGIG
jgi:hypothetical protein